VAELRLLAYVDGGGGGQGGAKDIFIGVVVSDRDTGEVLVEHSQALGPGTNNEAEWSAVIFAAYQAHALGAASLLVRSDSKLIVNQYLGIWAVHENRLGEYAEEAHRAAEGLDFDIEWVPRGENEHADRLTRELR
jgi:ribonuclease HI